MCFRTQGLRCAALILLVASFTSAAELPSAAERNPAIPNLPLLAQKSGYIFSGTVQSVERVAATGANSIAVMRITFHVEKGYAGVRSGQQLVIQECAGLWQSRESYRPGDKVLLFLYPRSRLGLTSPVGAMSGRFAVDPGGRIIIDPGRTAIGPPHRPTSARNAPERILLKPEDFDRALHSALQE
jgi:hypothetical protein